MNTRTWLQNGTKVKVTVRSGRQFEGVISGGDYNMCTFKKEYFVDYETLDGKATMMGVPEENIEVLS